LTARAKSGLDPIVGVVLLLDVKGFLDVNWLRHKTRIARACFTTVVAATMTATKDIGTSLATANTLMAKRVTTVLASMAAGEKTLTFLITSTSRCESQEIACFLNFGELSMLLANGWKSTINVQLVLSSHVSGERLPKRIAANTTVLGGLTSGQRNRVAKDVQSAPSSRECNDQTVLAVKESNVQVVVTTNQREKDDIVLLTLVRIDCEDLEIGVAGNIRVLLQLLQNGLSLAVIELSRISSHIWRHKV
jgi:hypothetical protein